MKKNWKIGVIGVYGRGRHAYKAHRPEQGFEIVMGADPYDPSPKTLANPEYKSFTDTFPGSTLVKDYKELVANKDIDIVFVMSPDHCHEDQVVAALEAGKHVYVEKPMAITVEGCDRILKTAYRTKAKLFAVCKTGRCVNVNGGSIDSLRKSVGISYIFGYYTFTVTC